MLMKVVRLLLHRRTLLLVALPGWCVLLVLVRWARSGQPAFTFLVWNLLLAMIPFLASGLLVRAVRQGQSVMARTFWFALWLLFLPNAPYIVTDLVHLHPRPPVAFWYDIALQYSFTFAGVVLGYASVADVQALVRRSRGEAAGWVLAVAALMAAGFGVYLGRFVRWNSWDALVHPHRVLRHVAASGLDPADHPRGVGVTLVYGVGLVMGYVVVRRLVPRGDPEAN
jgi:uncharacterized membrane protein